MNIRHWTVWSAAIFLLAAGWPATPVPAATVSGKASTEIEVLDSAAGETAVPVYQYILLNARDLDDKGLNFMAYGRLGYDLNDEVDADSRLYYIYLEKNNIADRYDVKLGRQFIATTAGASVMDGLLVKVRNLGPATLRLFGGGDVSYYSGYDGEDLMVGGELSGRFQDDLTLAVSAVQKYEDGDLTHELIGLDGEYDLKKMLNLYGEVQYDNLKEDISYFLGGAKYHRSDRWTLRAEYLYSLPVFSSTSIYSVFAVDQFEEVSGEFTYRIRPGLSVYARLSNEMYESYDDAQVLEVGAQQIRTKNLSGYLAGTMRSGDQDLRGVKAYAGYLVNHWVQVGVGAHVDVLERRLDADADETTSSRLWVDATLFATKKIDIQAKIERIESDLWDNYYRGRVRLNIRF